MRRIYLDHTATTPLDPLVRDAMQAVPAEAFGNPSSSHWFGRQARQLLESSREAIAQAVGCSPSEIILTSGGTESDNHAIRGSLAAARASGRDQIVTTAVEHHAVLDTCRALEQGGARLTVLPVDGHGQVRLGDVAAALTERTALVSVIHGNNETGTIAPIRAIAEIAHERGVLVHTDAVQTVGKIPVDVAELGVDLLTFTSHKLYGPKGIGALYVRKGVPLANLLEGGGQERGRRPGTENVPLAVGFARAVEIAAAGMARESIRLASMRDALQARLLAGISGLLVNGHPSERLPHILNVSINHAVTPVAGEVLVPAMDLEGIAVSSGSACTSGSEQPSHVLLAIGRDRETARATIRFSFGRSNVPEDVERAAQALEEAVRRMSAGDSS
jgi:cysteine desulfurase